MSAKKGADFLKFVAEYISKANGFDKVLKNIQITGGGNGQCLAEFTVAEEHLNKGGTLHGGFTATLIDCITTYALMTKDSHPGVSVDLYVSYLKAAKEGDEVIIDAKTVKAGKTLAFLECELRQKKDGSLIAKGGQTKYVRIIDGGDGRCLVEFTVTEEHLNKAGTLHGGFTTTLIDNISTIAMMTQENDHGVSFDMYISYLKDAKEGDEVIVDAKIVKSDTSLKFLECELRHKKDGLLIAKGSHTKFMNL